MESSVLERMLTTPAAGLLARNHCAVGLGGASQLREGPILREVGVHFQGEPCVNKALLGVSFERKPQDATSVHLFGMLSEIFLAACQSTRPCESLKEKKEPSLQPR